MTLIVKYAWRELNDDGTLTKFSLLDGNYYCKICDILYDSEEEALSAFTDCLDSGSYVTLNCVIIKVYGWI